MKRNIIQYVTWQYLKKNPRRTLISVITMALSVVLLTCVFTGRDTAVHCFTKIAESEYGSWHLACYDISPDEYEKISSMSYITDSAVTENRMLSEFHESGNILRPFLNLRCFSEKAFEWDNITITEGRLPENSSEIVLSEAVRKEGSPIQIGDTLDAVCFRRYISYSGEGETIFPFQSLIIKSGETKEVGADFPYYTEETGFYETHTDIHEPTGLGGSYIVTGFIEAPSFEAEAGAYTAITYTDASETDGLFNCLFTIDTAKFTDAERRELRDMIGNRFELNTPVLSFTGDTSSDSLNFIITAMQVFFILIIMFVSLILIRSLFDLSYDSRRKYLGILTSIGATSAQKRSSVYFEALLYAAAGLIIGIPLGLLVTKAGMRMLEPSMIRLMQSHPASAVSADLVIRPAALVLVIVFTLLTALLSALKPARTVAKIGPIESIRGNDSLKTKTRQAKTDTTAVSMMSSSLVRNDRKRSRGIVSSAAVYIILVTTVAFAASEVIKMTTVKLEGNYILEVTDDHYDVKNDTDSVKSCVFSEFPNEVPMTEAVRLELAGTDGISDIRTYTSSSMCCFSEYPVYSEEYFSAQYAVLSRFYPEGLSLEECMETFFKDTTAVIGITAIEDDLYASILKKLNVTGHEKGCLIMNEGSVSTKNWGVENRKASDYLYMEISRMTSLSRDDPLDLLFADPESDDDELMQYQLITDGFVTNKDLEGILKINDYNLWIIIPQSLNTEMIKEIPSFRNGSLNDTYFRADMTSEAAVKMMDRLYGLDNEDVWFGQISETSEETVKSSVASMIRILMICFTLIASLICCLSLYSAITGLMNSRRTEIAMLKSIGAEDRQIFAICRSELTRLLMKAACIGITAGAVICFLIRKAVSARFGSYAVSFPALPIGAVLLVSLMMVYLIEYRAVRKISGPIIENIRGLS